MAENENIYIGSNDTEEKSLKIDQRTPKIDTGKFETSNLTSDGLSEKGKRDVLAILSPQIENATSDLINKLKTESQEVKKDFITFFGLFASFITFLSIEVQIFRSKNDILELCGLSAVFLSFIIIFAICLNEIGRVNRTPTVARSTYVLTGLIFIGGLVCLYLGRDEDIKKFRELETRVTNDSIIFSKEIAIYDQKIQKLDSIQKATLNNKKNKRKNSANAN